MEKNIAEQVFAEELALIENEALKVAVLDISMRLLRRISGRHHPAHPENIIPALMLEKAGLCGTRK